MLARAVALCQGGCMVQPNPVAGGFLLSLLIVVGLVVGIAIGSPFDGAIGGTVAGIAVALLVWLTDRRRRGG
jgi:hypothetical protein